MWPLLPESATAEAQPAQALGYTTPHSQAHSGKVMLLSFGDSKCGAKLSCSMKLGGLMAFSRFYEERVNV